MSAIGRDTPRRIIPRFHSLDRALRQGELGSLREAEANSSIDARVAEEIERIEREWRETSKISAAAELVGSTHLLELTPAAEEAARVLLETENIPAPTARIAREVLKGDVSPPPLDAATVAATLDPARHTPQSIHRIARLKAAIRRDPRQALAWAELARQYEVLGQQDHAHRAMAVALRIAPESRFVLRSAARLAMHHGDPERGHQILARSGRTKFDPWLVSAEIAMASVTGKSSRLMRHGRRILESHSFSEGDTTELASALATEELIADRTKHARRLFDDALRDPTENTVAQVGWASRHGGILLLPRHLETPESYEARAWQHSEQGDWPRVVENSWLWLATLPFAAAPGVFGSYHAAVGRDFEQGAALARASLLANPSEFLLRNNLAFCLLQLDRLDEAQPHLEAMGQMRREPDQEATFRATQGLAAFRRGDADSGRALYEDAIRTAHDPGVVVIASIELAREELLANTPFAASAASAARAIATTELPSTAVRAPQIKLLLESLDEAEQTALMPHAANR